MSYFKCDHGKMYHPFGELSKVKLQKAIRSASMMSAEEADVPMVEFPLTQVMSDLCEDNKDSTIGGSEEENSENLTTIETQPRPVPLVERLPKSEAATAFDCLATVTLEQIFLKQLNAQMVIYVFCVISI